MDDWSIARYGNPCRDCGYAWSLSVEETVDLVAAQPAAYAETIGDVSGSEHHPDLAWSVTAYVCHASDNLRIWAERLQGVLRGRTNVVGSYDDNRLAMVRGYEAIDVQAALWSLTRAAHDWCLTVRESLDREAIGRPVTLVHPERGQQRLVEIARANCHDVTHHRWDIRRIVDHVEPVD
ncbi:MAG: hypothetical protein WBG41_07300 [Acidimicrobiales bacterium]